MIKAFPTTGRRALTKPRAVEPRPMVVMHPHNEINVHPQQITIVVEMPQFVQDVISALVGLIAGFIGLALLTAYIYS